MNGRQRFRQAAGESVQVRSIDDAGMATVGHIQGVSDNGLRLTLEGQFPLGSVIEVQCGDWKLSGVVIHECKSIKSNSEHSADVTTVDLAWNGTKFQIAAEKNVQNP